MAAKYVVKWLDLGNGRRAGKWTGHGDVRGYVPPKGHSAEAALIEYHPVRGNCLFRSEWWMFLQPQQENCDV